MIPNGIIQANLCQEKFFENSSITNEYISDLFNSAPLHDIGKVGVSDAILKKPGKLTEDEFKEIQKHCQYGADTLIEAEKKLDFKSFLTTAIQIALSHHEKWNGKGYPQGLKGPEIPLAARIMALANVYDALRSERCYKSAFSHEKTCEIIKNEKGEHFDPDIVDAFFRLESEFLKISELLTD